MNEKIYRNNRSKAINDIENLFSYNYQIKYPLRLRAKEYFYVEKKRI